ncbi:hypothetical protein ACIQCF_36940 [Streptomyces sp. NPDC088353]|uniref:hypothetical protein n=1 Tax=Streptomyces sp. NPDC088353 TaxID=3365855 RepID=UPI0037FC0DF1
MAPKLETLQDFFGGTALNTQRWNASSAAPNVSLDASLARVAVSCTTSYWMLGSASWDATASSVYARVTPAPVGNGTTETYLQVVLDGNNKASIFVSGGTLYARVTNAGTSVTTTVGAYDPYAHAWWGISESGGKFVLSTSPDAYTWTARATTAYTWNATTVQLQFVTGFYGTESAGLTAYVDHVNTTTSAVGQPNLNYPLIEDAWGPNWTVNQGSFPIDRYVEVSDRTRGTVSISRGRQYELDQVRSGEASLTLANTDAALDPINSSGPWAGRIAPYQPYRRRAQWPPTRNLLDQAAATAGTLGGYALGTIPQSAIGPAIYSTTDGTGGSFVSSSSAWQGNTVIQVSVPSGSAAASRPCHTPRWSVAPGQTYTMQMRVRDVTPSTSLSVRAMIGWYTAADTPPTSYTYGTTTSLTGSATAGWTTITVTATAPPNALGLNIGVSLAANAAASCNLQVDAWQLEKGSVATSWVCPGVWYPVFAGWTERWPSQWDMDGMYGVVQPTAVDTFSLLSQQQLSDPLTQEINSNSPRFVYRLDDPAASVSVADWTGNCPPAPLGISKYGAGSLTFGTAITATDPADGVYTGATGTVATFNNANPGTDLIGPATFIRLGSAGILGPATTAWTRMIAFRYTGPKPSSSAVLWSGFDNQRGDGNPSGSRLLLVINSSGVPEWSSMGPTGVGGARPSSTNVLDGNWHLVVFGMNPAVPAALLSVDGVTTFFTPNAATAPSGLVSDSIGAWVDPTVGNGTTRTFKGDVSFAAEFPSYLNSTAIANLYQAWKSSCSGESTTSRYSRILRYAGYSGVYSLQSGLTTSMGPATFDGQDAMSALQAVVDTEGGAHYFDRSGALQFKSRSNRYNSTTPAYVFGERADLGEWPYEDCQMDYDSTHLSNQVTVTQEGGGQNFYATDPASIAAYFPRPMSRTINSSSSDECQDAASYLLSRYRQPAQRVSSLKLHPSANPGLWAVCLSLELGTRVRVMRRPPGAPPVQVDCYVENMGWEFGDDNEAWLTLQCSPADLTPYGVFAAWRTTLNSSIAAGVTTVTVRAGQDNTNRLASQLAPGQKLVLGQGTANQETVTVLAVGATNPGWTTGSVTLTAATAKSHTAGDVVCEPLPSGVTDSATWDPVAKFDSIAFAY